MSMPMRADSRRLTITGNRVASAVVWGVGAAMTYAALDQMTEWGAGGVFLGAITLQGTLTWGQSPVWKGRGGAIAYALLALDAVINFGGTMAVLSNIDQMGSVQALGATFADYSGPWPMWLKGVVALVFSAIVAGLPEFLWELED